MQVFEHYRMEIYRNCMRSLLIDNLCGRMYRWWVVTHNGTSYPRPGTCPPSPCHATAPGLAPAPGSRTNWHNTLCFPLVVHRRNQANWNRAPIATIIFPATFSGRYFVTIVATVSWIYYYVSTGGNTRFRSLPFGQKRGEMATIAVVRIKGL